MAKKMKMMKKGKKGNPYANMVSGPMEKGNNPKKKEGKGGNPFMPMGKDVMKKGKKG